MAHFFTKFFEQITTQHHPVIILLSLQTFLKASTLSEALIIAIAKTAAIACLDQ